MHHVVHQSFAPCLHNVRCSVTISRESIFRYAHGDSIDTDPPMLDTEQSGWTKGEITKTLVPLMLSKNVQPAPECTCECHASCVSLSCICNMAIPLCTMFEAWQSTTLCCNEETKPL